MSDNFKIFFYPRKNYVNKNGEVSIRVFLVLNGERAPFTSEITTPMELWDDEENCASGGSSQALAVNEKLDDLKAELKFHYKELKRHDVLVTAEQIREAYLGTTVKNYKLLETFKEYNDGLSKREGKDLSSATVSKYKRTYKRLTEYIKEKHKRNDISFRQINYSFIKGFDDYLTTTWNCDTNTKVKYLQHLKTIVNIARNNNWISSDPFSNFKIKRKKSDRGYLTQDELVAIMRKKFNVKRLEQVRDVFVFCCFTGLSYIDVKNLKNEYIQKAFDGTFWIRKKREKTGVQSDVLMLKIAKLILDKYKGMSGDGYVLPVISNQNINGYLKEIADVCGIEKNLTFHLARHTFATTVTLAKGVPLETVSKMLGHTSLKTTQIYARITDQKIGHDMKNLSKNLGSMGNAFKP